MASRGDDVFSRDGQGGGGDFRGTRPRRPPAEVRDEAAPEAASATRSGMFGSTRLSGGSFKARFRLGRPS